MNSEGLFKKLKQLREDYTFPQDKRAVDESEKELRIAIVKQEAGKLDGIKELVKLLEGKIKDITFSLAWDGELKEDQRKNLFAERECYKYLTSFFSDAKQTIKDIEEMVEENLQ